MMEGKPYGEMSLEDLLHISRAYGVGHSQGAELRAELERRVWIKQIEEADSQIRSAWFQGAMVLLTALIVVAAYITLWFAK